MLVEMFLYHSRQTTCPEKFWFSSYDLKSSWPVISPSYFFQTKNNLKEFSEFFHDDSGDDSLPSCTNCMSRKILVLELWPKKLLASQIAWLLFQTLTENDFKEFSEFLHNDSRDDSVPSWTNCMPRKLLADEIRGTFEYNTK